MTSAWRAIGAMLAGILLLGPTPAQAGSYTFARIADDSGPFEHSKGAQS